MYNIILYRDLSDYGDRVLYLLKKVLVDIGVKYGIKTNLTVITVPIIEPKLVALNIDNHTIELNQKLDEKEIEKIILDVMSGNNRSPVLAEIEDLLRLVNDENLKIIDAA